MKVTGSIMDTDEVILQNMASLLLYLTRHGYRLHRKVKEYDFFQQDFLYDELFFLMEKNVLNQEKSSSLQQQQPVIDDFTIYYYKISRLIQKFLNGTSVVENPSFSNIEYENSLFLDTMRDLLTEKILQEFGSLANPSIWNIADAAAEHIFPIYILFSKNDIEEFELMNDVDDFNIRMKKSS
jgi:hypothetical protein